MVSTFRMTRCEWMRLGILVGVTVVTAVTSYQVAKAKYRLEYAQLGEMLRSYYQGLVEDGTPEEIREEFGVVIPEEAPVIVTDGPAEVVEGREFTRYRESFSPEGGEQMNKTDVAKLIEGHIFYISEAQFEGDDDYEKFERAWYPEQQVMVDDFGEYIPTPEDELGTEFVHHFAANGDRQTVWVRNTRIMCDYQIDCILGSFYPEE